MPSSARPPSTREEEDLFARRSRFWSEMRRTHPPAVRRVEELVTWVESGDYDRIRSGSYVRGARNRRLRLSSMPP